MCTPRSKDLRKYLKRFERLEDKELIAKFTQDPWLKERLLRLCALIRWWLRNDPSAVVVKIPRTIFQVLAGKKNMRRVNLPVAGELGIAAYRVLKIAALQIGILEMLEPPTMGEAGIFSLKQTKELCKERWVLSKTAVAA